MTDADEILNSPFVYSEQEVLAEFQASCEAEAEEPGKHWDIGATDPEHYAFPWHGREQKIDPTRPITSWRSAWRSILRAADLQGVRFHDGRHTAFTTLAEKGLPDWVIQAQVGHIAPQMMKTYSHVRRLALDEAAAALQPNFPKAPTTVTELVN